mmetsp:Transcript_12010/g.18449  ORF Transcript_12010/g.18449 Transcript_12010/m.18449 type:complete len:283 (-) Transcript_12010:112-960(-)
MCISRMASLLSKAIGLFVLLCALISVQGFQLINRNVQTKTTNLQTKSFPAYSKFYDERFQQLVAYNSADENSQQPIVDYQAIELGAKLRGTNIYLIGLMGVGKSTVGKLLASKFKQYAFLDTDTVIEDVAKKPIAQIFAEDGEESFREIESGVLDQLAAFVRCVVGTGGGIVTQQKNWAYLQTGLVVYLKMDPEDIVARFTEPDQIASRPLLQGENPQEKLEALLKQRKEMYEQADVTVEVAPFMDEEMVSSEIVSSLLEFIENNPPKYKQWKSDAEERGTI